MWSAMAADCAQPSNALPPPLRAQIISLSMGYDLRNVDNTQSGALPNNLAALEAEIQAAINKGIVVVFSSGNGHFSFPGMMPSVISAGGVFVSAERNNLANSVSRLSVLRYAIRTEIRLITSELATDLARFPGLNAWSTEDLNILATLFVNAMIVIAEAIEDAQSAEALEDIRRIAVKQLRMIAIGIAGWRSSP